MPSGSRYGDDLAPAASIALSALRMIAAEEGGKAGRRVQSFAVERDSFALTCATQSRSYGAPPRSDSQPGPSSPPPRRQSRLAGRGLESLRR